MTYTVIARDPGSGRLGIAIATYSLAVGASCPHIRPGVGAVSTQAATFAPHGPELLDRLERGDRARQALTGTGESDPHFEYRQVGVVTADGDTVVHTGSRTRHWAGSITGENWLVMGNALAGEVVLRAMRDTGEKHRDGPLELRLMAALEAGRDAGGQRGKDGHLPERSTALLIYGVRRVPELDLRVDAHGNAVSELRRILDLWARVDPYYRLRAERPDETPPQDVWMRDQGTA